jgi:hypothetical protein
MSSCGQLLIGPPDCLPKRCNSIRPIGNRPQVGNPPHLKTAIFAEHPRLRVVMMMVVVI